MLRGIPEGDCPSLYALPAPTPGTLPAPAGVEQPTHVHITSGNPFGTWMQVGKYSDGAPRTPGEWAPMQPCLRSRPRLGGCGRCVDRGQTYAAKQFADPVKNRTLLWSWAYVKPNSSMALLRVVTWNRELSQLEFAPLEEQAQLRGSVLAQAANVTVVAGQEYPLGAWTGGPSCSMLATAFTAPVEHESLYSLGKRTLYNGKPLFVYILKNKPRRLEKRLTFVPRNDDKCAQARATAARSRWSFGCHPTPLASVWS